MSIHIMSLVWERAPYEGGTLLALLALADWANAEGITWPSVAQIASKSRMQTRNVQYILRTLVDDGIVTRLQPGTGRSTTVYRINIDRLNALPPTFDQQSSSSGIPLREQKEPRTDFAPMQNLHDGQECTPLWQPDAPQGRNLVRPNRQGSVRDPSPSPTPPADTGGVGSSLPQGEGNGDNPAPPTHPPTPLASSPAAALDARGETAPPALTLADIRAFMATRWPEEARRGNAEGQPHAAPPRRHRPRPGAMRLPLHPAMWAMLEQARVPETLTPGRFGLWEISRMALESRLERALVGWPSYTRLLRVTEATLHQEGGEVVMEDSWRELRKHLPLWRAAHGRVLVTGLGLGCVVRGLLAVPAVTHVDVVEIDREIVRVVGAEFQACPRVTLHHADALTWPIPPTVRWDVAWHDIWAEEGLHVLHARLLWRFAPQCTVQGAWGFPREFKRRWPRPLLGGKRQREGQAPAAKGATDHGPAP